MDKVIAMEWADALESGKYEQGLNVLRTPDNKFCCLGVLCDMLKDKLQIGWSEEPILVVNKAAKVDTGPRGYVMGTDVNGDPQASLLPEAVKQAVKMHTVDGEFTTECECDGLDCDGDHLNSLVEMNDGGSNFSAIAAEIREHWAQL